jgi:Ca2+-binding RTX toxin-like protein
LLQGGQAVPQSLSITNTGSFLGAVDAIQIGSGLAGGSFSIDNSGVIAGTSGKGVNVQEFGSLGSYTVVNRSGATITGTTDGLRVGTKTTPVPTFGGTISIDNAGTIKAIGTGASNGQAIDMGDMTSATGTITVTNRVGALLQAADSDAITGGTNATINNYGTIEAKLAAGSTSKNNGIDFKGNAGGTINNYQGGAITGAHHAITNSVATGQTYAPGLTVSNDGAITGQLGSGINLDTASTTTVTITNGVHGTISGTAGGSTDGDGIDVDGLVSITNSGRIEAFGTATSFTAPDTAPPTSEAITVGGGTITNNAGGVIHSVQRAITVDDSNLGNAFAATSITNHGTITGDNGQAIVIRSAFDDTVVNDGTINGSIAIASTTAANGNATITNSGTIDGAVTTGGGADTIDNTGTITGTISMAGGADVLKLGNVHAAAVDMGDGTDTIRVNASAHAWLDGTITGAESIVLGAGASLDVAGAIGSAGIAFADASVQHLALAATALTNGDFANTLTGLGEGDTITVGGMGLATAATLGAGNVLTLTGGTETVTLHLDAGQDFSAERFHLSSDGAGGTVVTMVANSAPIVSDSTASGTEDTALTGTVSATDADHDALTYALATGPAHGTITFDAAGQWSYTPNADYNGADSFTWTASDGTATTAPVTFDITLAAVNDAPVLTGTQATLAHGSEDTAYTVSAADLLHGFTDVDGDTLSVAALSADHGTAVHNADGSWTITPDANYNGALTLSYTVADGNGGKVAATLSTTVDAVNDAPAWTGTHWGVVSAGQEDVPLIIDAATLLSGYTDPDGDILTLANVVADRGVLVDNHDGTFTLTLPANASGTVGLSYDIVDGNGGVASNGTAFIIAGVNDAPALTGAQATLAHGSEDTAYTVSVAELLQGFTDVDGASLRVSGLSVDHGTVAYDGDQTFTITPDANYSGTVTISYTVGDGAGGAVDATLSLPLDPVNDAPNAIALSHASVAEDSANGTVVGNLTASDGDDASGFTWALLDDAGGRFAVDATTGALTVADGGALDFETQASWTVRVQVTDAHGASYAVTETIALTNVAEQVYAGTKKADVFTAADDRGYVVNGLAGDDVLTTRYGADTVTGGKGNDTISTSAGNDVILIAKGDGIDAIHGGAGFDTIRATGAGTVITLSALSGVEIISSGGFAGVSLAGTKNADSFDFTDVTLGGVGPINGLAGNDTITGSAGADTILGGAGDDHLSGGLGADALQGGAGNDVLWGGRGSDVFTGGAGNDVFAFRAIEDSNATGGIDHIADFKLKKDVVDLSAIDANASLAGDQAFTFIGKAAFTGLGQLRYEQVGGHTEISGNVAGDLAADFTIVLDTAVKALTAADFVL